MCLDTLSKAKRFAPVQKTGYKVFIRGKEGLLGEYQNKVGPKIKTYRPVGEWLHSDDFSMARTIRLSPLSFPSICLHQTKTPGESYEAGWHVFTSRKDAKRWWKEQHLTMRPDKFEIRRIKWRKPVARGTQCRIPILVCKEIYIFPTSKDKTELKKPIPKKVDKKKKGGG